MPIYEKSWEEDLWNFRPVSLTLVLRKAMEQVILSVVSKEFKRISKELQSPASEEECHAHVE